MASASRRLGLFVPGKVFAWCVEQSRLAGIDPAGCSALLLVDWIRHLLIQASTAPELQPYWRECLEAAGRDKRYLAARWRVALNGYTQVVRREYQRKTVSRLITMLTGDGRRTSYRVARRVHYRPGGYGISRVFYNLEEAVEFRDQMLKLWPEIKGLPRAEFLAEVERRLPLHAS